MMRSAELVTALVLAGGLLLASGCAGSRSSGSAETPAEVQPEDGGTSQPAPDQVTLQGTLAETVEAGGWLLKTADKEYLLLSASRYRTESWFREGARIEVTGKEAKGVMTTHMQGTPFRVSSLRLLSEGGSR